MKPTPALLIQDLDLPKEFPSHWGRVAIAYPYEDDSADSWDRGDIYSTQRLIRLLVGLSSKQALAPAMGQSDEFTGSMIWEGYQHLVLGTDSDFEKLWEDVRLQEESLPQMPFIKVSFVTTYRTEELFRFDGILSQLATTLDSGGNVLVFGVDAAFWLKGLTQLGVPKAIPLEETEKLWAGLPGAELLDYPEMTPEQGAYLLGLSRGRMGFQSSEPFTDPAWHLSGGPRGGTYIYNQYQSDAWLLDED